MIPHHRHHMTILSTYPTGHPLLYTSALASAQPPQGPRTGPSPCFYGCQRTSSSSDRKRCPFGVVLHAPNRVRAPSELQPGTTDTRCLLDRSRPLGAPDRGSLTFSEQGGPAASEANSTSRPLGRSSQCIRGTRRLPASVYIFLHLDRAPATNRNRKLGRCHSSPGGGDEWWAAPPMAFGFRGEGGLSRRPS